MLSSRDNRDEGDDGPSAGDEDTGGRRWVVRIALRWCASMMSRFAAVAGDDQYDNMNTLASCLWGTS